MRTEPRAASARDDRETGRVAIELVNGCTYAFPVKLAQELQGASDRLSEGLIRPGVMRVFVHAGIARSATGTAATAARCAAAVSGSRDSGGGRPAAT